MTFDAVLFVGEMRGAASAVQVRRAVRSETLINAVTLAEACSAVAESAGRTALVVRASDLVHLPRQVLLGAGAVVVSTAVDVPSLRVLHEVAHCRSDAAVVLDGLSELEDGIARALVQQHESVVALQLLSHLTPSPAQLRDADEGGAHGLSPAQLAVTAVILGSPSIRSTAHMCEVLGCSHPVLRRRLAEAGWPPPAESLRLLRSLLLIWACCERGRTLTEWARRHGKTPDRASKWLQAATGMGVREWRSAGGFPAAIAFARKRLSVE